MQEGKMEEEAPEEKPKEDDNKGDDKKDDDAPDSVFKWVFMSSYQVLIFLGISLKLDNFKILKKCIFVKFNFF